MILASVQGLGDKQKMIVLARSLSASEFWNVGYPGTYGKSGGSFDNRYILVFSETPDPSIAFLNKV